MSNYYICFTIWITSFFICFYTFNLTTNQITKITIHPSLPLGARSGECDEHWMEWISSGKTGEVCSIALESCLGQIPNWMDHWLVQDLRRRGTIWRLKLLQLCWNYNACTLWKCVTWCWISLRSIPLGWQHLKKHWALVNECHSRFQKCVYLLGKTLNCLKESAIKNDFDFNSRNLLSQSPTMKRAESAMMIFWDLFTTKNDVTITTKNDVTLTAKNDVTAWIFFYKV